MKGSDCSPRWRGSSPLTRGKLVFGFCGRFGVGLIPAHAGKTTGASTRPQAVGAHPRSRGENQRLNAYVAVVRGSSPLTRGKPVRVGHAYWWSGLIPAHAGKTTNPWTGAETRAAHPRSRGENVSVRRSSVSAYGSSPLTRGKPRNSSNSSSFIGLIPAHAGKTLLRSYPARTTAAHPRSRGENWFISSVVTF